MRYEVGDSLWHIEDSDLEEIDDDGKAQLSKF